MSLITETGAGLPDAESLCSVADALAYHAARGITTWATLTTTEQEQALRRGTAYMGQVYRMRWAGVRTTDVQALDWPRYDVPRTDGPGAFYGGSYYPSDAVPTEVRNACAEAALRAAAGELAPDVGRVTTREKVGPLEVEYGPGVAWVRYRAIDNLLAPFLKASGGASTMLTRT